ncbi:MAG: N-methyl-L-tryptophan oxidase [Verrucomicrobiales bacterium]
MELHEERTYDVIVAGIGSVGAAACYHLAKRGLRVLGVEQFQIPHTEGSHHGHSRMIRQAYFEHPDYVPLLRRAYALWAELQEASANEFFHVTGGLYIGPGDGAIVSGSLEAARMHGLEHSLLSLGEVLEHFPDISPPPGHLHFYEALGGFLVPERAVLAHADAARRSGATLRCGEKVLSWSAGADHVELVTDRATYKAEKLVVTAGAWSAELAQELGIGLEVTRQILAWFRPLGDPSRFAPGRFPCWFIESEPPYGHYGFPVLPGDPGLKVAQHKPGEAIDPGGPFDPPRPDEIEKLKAVLDQHFPGCAGELAHACTCKYTVSPDSHFIVGTHPMHERVSVACGLSGHGFKFSSVLGEALSDLAAKGETSLPIGFLNPLRFSGETA